MKDMKKIMFILVLGALMACLVPAQAQSTQDWQTSTMQGSGSAYSSQVTAVGAVSVSEIATTTESYSAAKAPSGPRRGFDIGGDTPTGPSPIGDAVLPMLVFALIFCGGIALRRRKRVA